MSTIPFIDSALTRMGLYRKPILNSEVNRLVERRLREMQNDDLVNRISSIVSYDLEAVQNYVQSYYDPNPIHRNKHFKGLHDYYESDMDTKILSNFNQRKDTLINRPWMIRPSIENDRLELIKAGFAKQCMLLISNVHKKKRAIISDMDYGYSVCEKILGFQDVTFTINTKVGKKKRVSERITIKDALVIKDIDWIIPTAFSFDGQKRMYYGKMGSNERIITPEEQVNLIRSTFDDRFGSPWGWPLRVPIFPHRIQKKALLAWRLIYLERFGVPSVDVEYPETITNPNDPAIKKIEAAAKSLQKEAVVTHPKGWTIKFIEEMNKVGTMDMFQNAINYSDQCISELVLGHKQATEATSVGSLASSTVKEAALRQAILETDGMNLDTNVSEQIVQFLIDLNFPSNGLYPDHITYVEGEKDLEERRDTFKFALESGMAASETQMRRELHIDHPLDEFDAVEPEDVVRTLQYRGVKSQSDQKPKGTNGEAKLSKSQRRKLTKRLVRHLERTKDFDSVRLLLKQ